MSIAWRDAMSVGDASIDADHKHLVELINDFEAAIAGRIDHKRIASVLLGLFEYTADHFQREEEIQLRVRYPYYESHRRSHRDVLGKLTGLVQDYTQAGCDGRDDLIRAMARFLKDWLVDHIIQSDLRMKPYIAAWQRQADAAAARAAPSAGTAPTSSTAG